jgi:hypothetical protein
MFGKKVVVVGSMNCMPTEYAIALAHLGADVINYYDAGPNDSLSNPFLRYPRIADYINVKFEKIRYDHPLYYIASVLIHYSMIKRLKQADIVILSGPAISLGRFLKGKRKVIAIGYGDDISLFCNSSWPVFNFQRRSFIAKLIFGWILLCLQKYFVYLQRLGLISCEFYSYFVPGIDIKTDAILNNLVPSGGAIRLSRFAINLNNVPIIRDTCIKKINARLKVIFPVRFNSSSVMFADKGWKKFINSANNYIKTRKKNIGDVAFICFNKGDQVAEAKIKIKDLSIDKYFYWFDVVPFYDLYSMINDSDVVVDQLGEQWIGVGLWGGLLGKPVISNLSNVMKEDMFKDSYFLHAENSDQFCHHLLSCESLDFLKQASIVNPSIVRKRFSIENEIEQWLNP